MKKNYTLNYIAVDQAMKCVKYLFIIGEYIIKCVLIGNAHLSLKSSWLLFVEMKPAFTKKLSDVKVKEKEKATLSCEMNKENVKVIWKKNSQELKSNNRVKIVADSKVHQLIIENVTIEDKAEYSCVAAGDVSTSANIIVEGTLIFSFAFF